MRPDVRNLVVSTGLFSTGYSILTFTIPLFAVSVGASQSELGFIALLYTVPSLFVPIAVGKFLDRARAMRVTQVAMLGYSLPTLLFFYGSNLLEVAVIRAVQGCVNVAIWVAVEKELADLSSPGGRGRVMSSYNVSWSVAFIVGPVLGGFLIEVFDFGAAFVVTFLWQVAALIVLVIRTPRKNSGDGVLVASPVKESEAVSDRAWESRDLIAACLTVALTGVDLGILFSLFPAYLIFLGFSPLWAGFLLLLFSASRVGTFLVLGHVIDRMAEHKVMLAGLVLSVCVVVLGSTARAEFLALGLIVLGVGSGMTYAGALTLISRSPSKGRGSTIGKFEFSFALGIALMAQIGGLSADLLGPWSPYLLSGAVVALGSAVLLVLNLTRKKRKPD